MNRITIVILTFFASLIVFNQLHKIAIDYIYTNPTTDMNIVGQMSKKDQRKAEEITKQDNIFIDRFKGKQNVGLLNVRNEVKYSVYYRDAAEEEISVAAERIYKKIRCCKQ